MQLRSFILLGFCAVFGMSSAAFASPASLASTPSVEKTDAINVAAKGDASQLKLLKKKKNPTSSDLAEIGKLEAKIAADKEDAKAKALEARKMAMREAAKAKADAARQEWLAKRNGGTAPATELADAKVAKKKTKIIEPLEPVAPVQSEDPIPDEAMNVTSTGNNGELRSEQPGQKQASNGGLFAGLFGGSSASSISYLPETRALDSVLARKDAKRPFKVKPEFVPQDVNFTGYAPGTIVIDTSARRLYLVESYSTARRYAIAVGREGLQFKGTVAVGDKQEWPRWIPTLDMQKREPKHYGQYKDGMPGGGENPLGARAIYLYDGKKDTHLRIHGTIAPSSIGTSASNGCFRMINEHVMDLYSRVRIGTKVVII